MHPNNENRYPNIPQIEVQQLWGGHQRHHNERNELTNEGVAELGEMERRGILINNLKVIFCLNFIPIISLLFSLIFYQWYLFDEDNGTRFWVYLLFIYDESRKEFFSMEEFRDNKCNRIILKDQNKCSMLVNFKIAGFISFLFITLGIVMQIYNLLQIFCILMDKSHWLRGRICFKQKTIHKLVMLCYLGSVFFWFLSSGIIEYGLANLGICFYSALCGAVIYSLTTCYFNHVKRELKNMRLIYDYVNPDRLIQRN